MEFQNFPQPTRPTSITNLTSFTYSEAPIVVEDSEPSTSTSKRDEDEAFDELTQILIECLENVDYENKGFLLRRIFFELEKDSQLEDFILEKLKNTRVKVISELLERYTGSLNGQIGEDEEKYDQKETVNRGFTGDLMEDATGESMAEFSRKLERFKVKTISIEGGTVVKK